MPERMSQMNDIALPIPVDNPAITVSMNANPTFSNPIISFNYAILS
jgi:hypothetical protein